jgi:hypothetical protein
VTAPADGGVAHAGWSVKPRGKAVGTLTMASAEGTGLDEFTDRDGIEAGDPVEVSLRGGKLPKRGAMLRRTLPKPLAKDATAVLAYWDEKHKGWRAVPTTVSRDRRRLSARVTHFSKWDDITYAGNWLLDTRADQPKCEGSPPAWAKDITYLDDKNAPLRWCVGHDPKDRSILVVKLAVNRSYGMGVHTAVKAQWAYDSIFQGGPKGFLTGIYARSTDVPDDVRDVFGDELPLMGGQEAHFGFTEAQVRKIDAGKPLIRVTPDAKNALVGFTYDAIMEFAGEEDLTGRQVAAIVAIVAIAQCWSDIGTPLSKGKWADAAKEAGSCVIDSADDIGVAAAGAAAKALPKQDPKKLGKLVGKIAGKLWQAWVARSAFRVATWQADRHLEDAAFQLSVFPPVLKPKHPPLVLASKCSAYKNASPDARETFARKVVARIPEAASHGGEAGVAYAVGFLGGRCDRATSDITLNQALGDETAVARSFEMGAAFDEKCVVAWPTAPTRTSRDIQMTMDCTNVPKQYLLTKVVYGDPNLPITPSTGQIRVRGHVVDVARSEYGFKLLVVQADSVDL